MKVLEGVLAESKDYYLDAKQKLIRKVGRLPKGSVKERNIHGGKYYYLQKREGQKVIQKYLGKNNPAALRERIAERKALQKELKEVNRALAVLKRLDGRRRAPCS